MARDNKRKLFGRAKLPNDTDKELAKFTVLLEHLSYLFYLVIMTSLILFGGFLCLKGLHSGSSEVFMKGLGLSWKFLNVGAGVIIAVGGLFGIIVKRAPIIEFFESKSKKKR